MWWFLYGDVCGGLSVVVFVLVCQCLYVWRVVCVVVFCASGVLCCVCVGLCGRVLVCVGICFGVCASVCVCMFWVVCVGL